MKISVMFIGNKVIYNEYSSDFLKFIFLGSYDLALKHYTISLEIKTACLPAQHPSIAETLENLGRIYESKRDFPQALSYFQKASAIYRRAFSSTDDKVTQIDEHIRRISHMK
jgi:tetratricopeptide (TPR) repeat protein